MRTSGAISLLLMIGVSGAHAQYPNGFEWRRETDFDSGTVEGAAWACGNPSTDLNGNLVWSHEVVTGGGAIGSPEPWYTRPPAIMVWDNSYFGNPRWVRVLDNTPFYSSTLTEHFLWSSSFAYVPLARWRNPTGRTIHVSISGSFRLNSRAGQPGQNAEAVIVRRAPPSGYSLVLSVSAVSPGDGSFAFVSADVPDIEVPPEGELIFSVRGTAASASTNDTIFIADLITITLIAGGDCPIDANGDRQVTFADVTAVLANFNAVCP